jgi:hypothetical protein
LFSSHSFTTPDEGLPASGVGRIEFSLDGAPFEEYVVRLRDLALGDHSFRFRAVDRVANQEETHEIFIRVRAPAEDLPPLTTLLTSGATVAADGTFLLKGGTPLGFAAEDAFSFASYPSGVAGTFYSLTLSSVNISSPAAARYSDPFTLGEGTFTLTFFSVDFAGNREVAVSTRVHVDGTPPTATIEYEGPELERLDGTTIVGATTAVRIDAFDPPSPGGATGWLATIFLVDRSPEDCGFTGAVLPPVLSTAPAGTCQNPYYQGAFVLSPGSHVVSFLPIDSVGNLGELSTAAIHVDADPPSRVTDLVATAVGDFSLTLAWTAPDDEVAGVGLYRLWYATVPFDESTLSLALPARDPPTPLGPGSRQEAVVDGLEAATTYFFAVAAVDRVANQASLSIPLPAATRLPDRTPPITTQSLDGFSASLDGILYLSTATSIILSASEAVPPAGQSARGVAAVYYAVDPPSSLISAGLGPDTTSQFSVFPGSFTLPEGPRTLAFGAADKAGNYEQIHVASFTIVRLEDRDAPTTRLVAFGTTAVLGADLAVTAGSLLALVATDDLPAIGASGVGTMRLRFNGIETPYSAPFTLPSGSHTLSYWSIDRAGNPETPNNLTVIVPPGVLGENFSLSLGGVGSAAGQFNRPQDVAVDASGNLFVSDFSNARVQKFSSAGVFQFSFGSRGTGPGQFGGSFGGPGSLAVSKSNGNVLVVDLSNRRVQEFTASGVFVRSIVGSPNFSTSSLAVDTNREGNIYVMDNGNQRIYRFTGTGQQLGSFSPAAGTVVMSDMAIGFDDTVYIGGANGGMHVVQRYALTGVLLSQWPGIDPNLFWTFDNAGTLIKIFNQSVNKVAVDLQGNVFVGDDQENSVRIYSSTGGFIATFGPNSSPSGTLSGVAGLGVDAASGKAYVADYALHVVKAYAPRTVAAPSRVADLSLALQPDGTLAAQWTAPGAEGSVGTAALYELRQSTVEINAENYYLAAAVPGLPTPSPPGTIQTAVVDGLSGGATVYLALLTFNVGGAVSEVSNVPGVPVPFISRSDVKIGPRPEVIILSGSPLELVKLDATQGLGAEVQGAAASASLTAVSGVYSLQPAGPLPSIATGFITIQVDATRAAGFAEGELRMYTFESGAMLPLPGQAYDEALSRFTAHLTTAAPIGVFGPVEDVLAPVTRLEVESGNALFLADGGFLISGPSKLRLVGFDPISKATASGVAATVFTVSAGLPQGYEQPIGFPEGRNTIAFHSIDHVGNAEVTRSSAVLVDATAPRAHLVIRESTGVVEGSDVLSATALFDLVGIDPVVNAVSAGVESVEASIGGGPFTPSTAPFSLSLEAGELTFRARDRVGNLSAEGRVTLSKPPWPAKGYAFSGKFGSKGALDSQFTSPQEIAVDIAGDFYVSDSSKLRVFKFSKDGQFQFSFGGSGTGPGKFGSTFGQFGLATVLDASGNLFVTDNGNRRVQKFSSDGQFLTQISTDPGTGQFYFGSISDLALDRVGNLWVLSSFRNLVKFAPSGEFLGSFSLGLVSGENAYSFAISPDDSIIVQVQRFSAPFEVFRVYDRDIQFLRQWNSPTNHTPIVSGTDFFGNVVAVVGSPPSVNIYTPTGALLTALGTGGPSGQNVAGAGGAAVDKLTGRVFVSDAFEGDVKYFDVDQVAPAPPVVVSPPENASLRTFAPLILGSAEGGSTLSVSEGSAILFSTPVPADGSFSFRIPSLAKGLHNLQITARDKSGNISQPAQYRIDVEHPNPAAFSAAMPFNTTSPLYAGAVKTLTAGDFDVDGRQDVMVFGSNGYGLFRGLANGGFSAAYGKQYATFANDCSDAARGDINGDGFQDAVAVCRFDSTRLVAVLGTGTTSLGSEQLLLSGTVWSRILLTDWNRDGKLDIVGLGSGMVMVLYGSGNGTFASPITLASGIFNAGIAVADVDADGMGDLVAGNRVLFGDGTGAVSQTVVLAGDGLYPAVADFNADGISDVWLASPGQFSAHLGRGARTFTAISNTSSVPGGVLARQVADLNRDSFPDVLVDTVRLLPASGDGGSGAAQSVASIAGGDALLLDTDGDGLLDLIQAANEQSLTSLRLYRNLSGPPDVIPPAAITDLIVTSPLAGTLELSWTAPGDDGLLGTATRYDIKFASYPIDAANFDSVQNPAIRDNFPAPATAGTRQTARIGGYDANLVNFQALPMGATYYVRIRATDEVEQAALDAATPSALILGSDLAISSSQVRFIVNEGSLELYACPENRGPAISPTGEIAIVAGPSSGTPTDLAGPYYSDAGFHFIPLGDCRQGTRFQYLDAGDEALRSFPVVRGQREFGVYLQHYPPYVPSGLDPDPSNNILYMTIGIGEDGQIDNTAPAPVTDLVAELLVDGRIELTWSAPGDDALTGTAKNYEIRASSISFSAAEYQSQTVAVASVPVTASAGEVQSHLISGFPLGTTVFFALRAFDDADNPAEPSNLAQAETPFIAASPAAEGSTPELTFVSSRPVTVEPIVQASTAGTVILAAAGDQGLTSASGLFEIGPDGIFDPPATLVFRYSTATLAELGLTEGDIAVYEFFAGQGWVRLANQTLDAANGRIFVSLSSIASQFGIFGVVQDRTAPVTSLRAEGGASYAASDGTIYRSSSALYGFLAEDPVVNSTSTGLSFTEYRLGASTQTPFQRFTADFPLPEGRNLVSFRSQDHAGNEEVERSSTVLVDATSPLTALRPSAEFYVTESADGPRAFAAAKTTYALDAQDPPGAGVASGVGETLLAIGTAPLTAAPTSFSLSEGVRLLSWESRDNVGNTETLNRTTIHIDATPPVTALSATGPQGLLADGITLAVSSRTTLALTAEDPEREGVASGLRETLLGVDTTTLSAQAAGFVLEEPGPHLLRFRSVDQVMNEEELRAVAVVVDTAPPAIAIAGPAAGSRYVARGAPLLVDFSALDAYDPAPSSAAFLVRLLDRGSPAGERPAVVAVRSGESIAALDLDDGVWELRVSATDFALNGAAAAGGAFEVLHDVLPPRTSLVIGEPRAEGGPEGALFITKDTEFALQSFDDLVALDDGIGLGVARQDLSVDGADRGPFLNPDPSSPTFRSTFTLQGNADGLRLLAFGAADALGNVESVRVTTMAVDNTAPLTSLTLSGGRQAPASEADAFYASTDTVYALTALDPASGGVAAGLDATFLKRNEAAPVTATSTFTLSEGRNALAYWSQDRLANVEVARTTMALVDATPPLSVASLGSPSFIAEGGVRYVSSSTLLSLSAADPALPDGPTGSGLDRIEASLDDAPFAVYTSSLAFSEGKRHLRWRALDRVGNLEGAQSLELRSDASVPETTLAVLGGRQASGPDIETFYASSDTRFALPAADPIAAEVASGLDSTRWQDNGGPLATFSAPLTLTEGAHHLAYQSRDRVENLEVLRSTTVLVDATAPQSSFSIGAPAFVDPDGARYVTPTTPITFSAQDPALPGGAAGSGVERIEVAVDVGAYSSYSGALTFPEGRHTVQFRAIDRVGNSETAQTLTLRSDHSAPQTSLAVQGGTQAPGPDASSLYASSGTQVVLTATDPTVADVASGLDFIRWQDNEGPLSTYFAPLTLSEGAHLLAYQSQDRVENLEVLRSTTILLDATAPQSAFAVGSPSFTGPDGTRFISPATPVTFSALDPALPGGTAGSGIQLIEVAIDGGAFATYSTALTFPEGRHTVQFRALDRVGNIEATQSLALRSDDTAAQTILAIQGGRQAAGPTAQSFYASSDTRLALLAADPVVADVASGVDFSRWQDSGGAYQTLSAPIALAEGSHLLGYQSQDHVGNLEVLKATTVIVDASAPNSAFSVGAPTFTDGDGTRYITPTSPISFTALDPALQGGTAGAGVERIEVAIDGGAFSAYSTALTFAEGRHTVLFRAIDRVGNAETTLSLALRSDASAPQTALAVQGGRQAAGPDAATFYASGDSLFAFPASDPVTADVASGVDFTRWRDGTGAFQTYSAAVSLAEGAHQISYQSQDRVANLEILLSTTVLVDSSAPQTAFAIGAPAFVAPDGTRYVTPATPVSFSAQDPALPGGAAGSGVDRIEIAVDGAPFAAYSAALTFAEGRHTVQFRAFDRVGNSETTQTLALRSDATPPQTAFSPSAAFYSDAGRDYAPAQFTYTLPATDPIVSNVASGVVETTFGFDAAPRHPYTGAFALTEGIRLVSFGSRDNVTNLEGERSATVYVDATAPQTSLVVSGGRQAPGPDANSFYASLDTRLSLPALDPSVSGVASGLDSTNWQDNGGPFQPFSAPIALGAGSHLLSFQSRDHVGNLEVLRSTTVLIDAVAPVTAFQIGNPAFVAADGTRFVTPTTPVTFTASDPSLVGATAGSGVERIEVSVDGAPFSAYTAALTFAEGRHTIQYRAVDRVGNAEEAGTLALRSDASAPQTSLAAQGGRQVAGPDANTFYASQDTRFALPATDPVVLDVAAGVGSTRWQDNGGAFQAYGSPIALAEGSHVLAYQSQDNVENQEVLRSTTVRIDATAPLTAFNIGTPSYTDAAGVHFITPTTPLTFTAQDTALPGGVAGSGVDRIEVALDAGAFSAYSTALTFAEGRHSVRFRAYDKVGNLEAERTLEVRSDASAPMSSLAVQGGRQAAGPDAASLYASADTRIALSAADPTVANVASGVELIRWRDNDGAFQIYSTPLALAEGSHQLAYQSQDRVQNVETLRSTTVLVDASAPHTAFQIGTPAFIDPSGTHYITPTTPVTFTAADPALAGGTAGAGAGVERIEVSVDGGAFATYTTALTFPEGRHTVQFRAVDRVGNLEVAQTLALRSDASSPLTSLSVQGGRQAAGADPASFYASSATRYALLAADPVVADVASGVEFTRWQDNGGSIMSYSGPIAFPEGIHNLTYASEDRVRNVEAQKAATALVDATPPITQFSLNGPRYAHAANDQSVGGELFVSPVTGLQLSPTDPVSNGVASGMDRLLASVDGAAFLPWPGGLSISQEGPHTVSYRGADRVGNEEGTRSLSLSVDATPPSTSLTFDGPALLRGPGTTWEPQQAEAFITPATKVILTTNDPASAGVASGVKLTRYRIDSGPWLVYTGYFYLYNQGLYLVEFGAEDRVGNLEALVAMRIAVDNTAPLVNAAVNGSWLEAFGLNLLSTAATVSLTAEDSPIAGVAVGLARILYRIDAGGLLEYTAPFALSPGSHAVQYHAVDLLGNAGAPQSLSVQVQSFLGGALAVKGTIDGQGNVGIGGLLQTDGELKLGGNVRATGGAQAFSISLSGNAILTGPVTQGVTPLASDALDLNAIHAALQASNDNARLPAGSVSGGVLRVQGNKTVTLASGTYLLGGVDISGNAKVLVSGPVRLFVTGKVDVSGNAEVNKAGPARNLIVFGTPTSMKASGNTLLAALVYLPAAELDLSGNLRLAGILSGASAKVSGNVVFPVSGLDSSAPESGAGAAGVATLASVASVGGFAPAAGALDTTFVLRDIYAFPNPAVRGQRPVLHAAVGIADKVTFRLYDIAGTPVHEATLDGTPQVIDDGNGPKYAYEYAWDGHIPSGVYLYVVTAEKSGHAPIKRVGKLAVVR